MPKLTDFELKKLAEAFNEPLYSPVNWNLTMIEAAHQKLNELSKWGLVGKMTVTAQVGGKDFVLELDSNGDGEWVEKIENKVTVNLKMPDDFVERVKKEFTVSYRDVVLKAAKPVGGLIPNSSGTIPALLSEGTYVTQQRVQLQDKYEKIKIGDGVYFDLDGYTAKPFGQRMGTFMSLADENGYAFVQPIVPYSYLGYSVQIYEPAAAPSMTQDECRCDIFNFGCTCGQMERERSDAARL